MEFIKTNIEGVVIVEPTVYEDERGYFFESYNRAEFGIRYDDEEIGVDWKIPTDKVVVSPKDCMANKLKDIPLE